MSDCSSKDCKGIHVRFEYSIVVIDHNAGADEFIKWYEKVFSKQHPNLKEDFDISITSDDGESVVEIMQHNPGFTLAALFNLFEADRNRTEETAFDRDTTSNA